MHYAKIVENSRVDGPGLRTAVFLQGCTIRCKGCQNRDLWDRTGGKEVDPTYLAYLLYKASANGNITISGGEPFDQWANELFELVYWIKSYRRSTHIIVYSGHTFEELLQWAKVDTFIGNVLQRIDVLVDGPFMVAKDDPLLIYRGSRNQRPVDVPESLRTGKTIVLDWDNPEIVLTPDGMALMPEGLAPEFAELGNAEATRRCGEQE